MSEPVRTARASLAFAENCDRCRLRGQTIFAEEDCSTSARIRLDIRHRRYTPNQAIFEEGDAADFVYNVAAGDVRLRKLLPDGRRQITGFLRPGDFVGLASRNLHAFGAEAINNVELCCIRADDLQAFLQERPHVAIKLLDLVADELEAAQEQMVILGRKTARERVLSFLLRFAERSGRGPAGNVEVRLPMTRSDIADYLGLCHETVSRAFSTLEQDGMLALHSPHRVQILDLVAARSFEGSG